MLQDRRVVITGGGRGLGRIFAQSFVAAGARSLDAFSKPSTGSLEVGD